MKNCIIMGFGRSGTSLMGGILHQAGYYMGDNLYPPRDTNPRGFFECNMINNINERILEQYDYYKSLGDYTLSDKPFSPIKPGNSHRWLSYISSEKEVNFYDNEIEKGIIKAISNIPFAFKDPRFNYTLAIWEKFLNIETIYICMFREPDITVNSVIKECQNSEYLFNFYIDPQFAEIMWLNSYLSILRHYAKDKSRFIFVHYKQLLNGSILSRLSDILGVELKSDFISQELNRTNRDYRTGARTNIVYNELCKIANYI